MNSGPANNELFIRFAHFSLVGQCTSKNVRCFKGDLRRREQCSLLELRKYLGNIFKESLKKLTLLLPLKTIVEGQQQLNKIQLLPIKMEHLYAASGLPYHHRDPFDRLLVAQAQLEDLTFLTADSELELYAVRIIK